MTSPTGLHEAFERQARRTPRQLAVQSAEGALTYAQLDAAANTLAHRLRRAGAAPEVVAAMAVERSVDAVVGLLGIMKSGAASLPLDPGHPTERLAFVLADSRAALLVARRQYCESMACHGVETVPIDSPDPTPPTARPAGDAPRALPANLAYVMYTSGSSGRPKGVGVPHSAALQHFTAMRHAFELTAADRVLQFAPLNFDVSLEQIFPALLTGAAVFVRGPEPWSASDLVAAVVERGITVVNIPPAFWSQLGEELGAADRPALRRSLRLLVIGGEAMSVEALRSWRLTAMGSVRLVNAYGPTEAVVTASAFDVRAAWEPASVRTVPIGRPLAGREFHVAAADRPAPDGTPGELSVGGEVLARGYLHRADLTAERFVPDPFSARPGGRMYRTGDLVRRLPTRDVEYLGRTDLQVKIRGFRIEPGEIEAVLEEHAGIRAAVVLAREFGPADSRLVAHMVPTLERSPTVTEIRRFLEERLPDYMLPFAYTFLEALPLTSNGKVDRRALLTLDLDALESARAFVAPRGPLEETLARIWGEVLGVSRVGAEDDFFVLGGHSLLVTQVVSRIRRAFQVELTVRTVFMEPTVAGLARAIAERQAAGESAVPAVQPLARVPRSPEHP